MTLKVHKGNTDINKACYLVKLKLIFELVKVFAENDEIGARARRRNCGFVE